MAAADTKALDWDFIVDTILAKRCVLFLGPELFINEKGANLFEQIQVQIGVKDNPNVPAVYTGEELFRFSSASAKTRSYYKLKNFFEQDFPALTPLLDKISELPIHLFILTTPDNLLASRFNTKQFPFKQEFYWKNRKPEGLAAPNAEIPLIYNLFGNVDQEESLILTHDDLFEYLKSIFGARGIPEEVKAELQDAHNFIFLGLPFDKWYMQLLMRLLYLSDHQYKFDRYAAGQLASDEVRSLCVDQFQINFVPNNITQFVDELHQRISARGKLRSLSNAKLSPSQQANQLLSADKLDEALAILQPFLEKAGNDGAEHLMMITLLSGQLSGLGRSIAEGTMAADVATLQRNQIRRSLVDLINAVKALETQSENAH